MSLEAWGVRLERVIFERGPLVAGIDPHDALLDSWGLPRTAEGVRDFGLRTINAVAGVVGIVKPQAAFFERFGSRGVAALEDVLAAAREANLLSILDVKRGDIGSTMEGYAQAHLAPGAPGEADAITLSPYLGFDALEPALAMARRNGKGVFILALTSNPEGAQVQRARTPEGHPVAVHIARSAGQSNAQECAQLGSALGSIGLVVGATIGTTLRDLDVDLQATKAPILAPGFGAQGAGPGDIETVFGKASHQVLPSISRALLQAGPDTSTLRRTAARCAEEYALSAGL